ncbi:MAG TPA: nuclear transport factor 2 family protein [Bryobacteraceae bacterium]
MSAQDNTRLIQESYAAFGRGDIPAVMEYLTDDIEWYGAGPKELPLAGTWRGRNEVREFFRDLNETQEILTFEPQEFIAEGDTVVVLLRYRARVKATGRTVETDLVHFFTVRGGKVSRLRQFYDTAALLYAHDGALRAQAASGA